MNTYCPRCDLTSELRRLSPKLRRHGSYYRRSDAKRLRRFRCLNCNSTFSTATHHPAYRQKKRQFNHRVMFDLCSSVTQRRIAKKLGLNRKTVARKLIYLAARARLLHEMDLAFSRPAAVIEFDELEDKEHSKCKPLSVPLAVEYRTRRMLWVEVARMPCGGLLAKRARALYGFRADERPDARRRLLERIRPFVRPDAIIKSDSNPQYPPEIRRYFPRGNHMTFLGKRGSIGGQGELKKVGFDPLFSLNHTCASLRANVSRLVRKTWSTTKKAERLADHLALYAWFHNEYLIAPPQHAEGPVSVA